ncbi:unnamed protein product [Schistocephalus solidus]|uniref:Fibroblast growth factor receptor-like 1 n=1 Tax=Schistocephalus solidus TaxID=70667 RepID=A0A183T3P6_SCHSO|nr:unnamed protein product [Schistocephalus solidus]
MRQCTALTILLYLLASYSPANSNNNVPVVKNHSRQIRLHVGDSLRLECPIWGSGPAHKDPTNADPNNAFFLDGTGAGDEDVMYQWNIRNIPDYSLAMNPRFRFSESGRIVELTSSVTKEDAGGYHCSGVTGFGRKEVTFEVYVADTNVDLLCAKTDGNTNNPQKMLCFVDPNMRTNKVTTVDALLGTSVDLNCEAMGTPPLKYLWFMGSSVADWISGGQDVRGPLLHIPKVGREHTGHYTCQVRNAIGTLNYTYRWLKRVEPHEVETYKKLGKSLVPLPTPRESEANELYVTLERWVEASVFTELNNQHQQTLSDETDTGGLDQIEDTANNNMLSEHSSGEYSVNIAGRVAMPEEQVFVSRLQLTAPVSSERHAGKYVVMTMSRANLKSIDYGVVYVKIIPKPFITSTHNVIVYFVVPIGFIILAICGLVYFLLCRRGRARRDSAAQGARAHNFGHSSFFSQGRSTSGKKELANYHNMSANKKFGGSHVGPVSNGKTVPLSPSVQLSRQGADGHSSSTEQRFLKGGSSSRTGSGGLTALDITTTTNSLGHRSSSCGAVQPDPNSYAQSSEGTQASSFIPGPGNCENHLMERNLRLAQQPTTSPPSSLYYSGIPAFQTATFSSYPAAVTAAAVIGTVPYWRHPAPSVATELSFDQYSAVSHSDVSGSTNSTNHYMSTFPEFPMRRLETESVPKFAFPIA